MKKFLQLAPLLVTLTFLICNGEARAQAFLNPVTAQAPSFLETGANGAGAYSSGGATGNTNNSNNLTTGTGAIKAGTIAGRQVNLQAAAQAILSGTPDYQIQYGGCTDGFPTAPPKVFGGRVLPPTSTGSVDLNVANSANFASNYTGGMYNPYATNLTVYNPDGTVDHIDFQETASEMATFVQDSTFWAGVTMPTPAQAAATAASAAINSAAP